MEYHVLKSFKTSGNQSKELIGTRLYVVFAALALAHKDYRRFNFDEFDLQIISATKILADTDNGDSISYLSGKT